MKRTHYLLFLGIIAAATLSSCEDVIPVELEQGETLLTVDGLITDDTTVNYKVTLSTTAAYFSDITTPRISDALVEIRDYAPDGTLITIDTLRETVPGSGDYYTSITNGTVNHKYVLKIKALGEEYWAEATINRVPVIDSLSYTYKEADAFTEEGYYVSYNGPEPAGLGDYYLFKVYRNGKVYKQPSDLYFASDELVDGNYIGDVDITPEPFALGDTIKVENYAIMQDHYYFYQELYVQVNNGGLFANPPANVRTNIMNVNPLGKPAVGYFGAAGISHKEVIIK